MASFLTFLPSVPHFHYFILFLLIQIPPHLCSNDDYSSCSVPYACGRIKIGFPFWGQNRPKWCGHPLLQFHCDSDQTYITIKDVTYKVFDANPDKKTMRIARVDYFQGLCPSKLVNTSLNPELLVFGSEYKNLTLFYNCHAPNGYNPFGSTPGFVNCFSNGTSDQYFYAQSFGLPPPSICTTSVVVPLMQYDTEDWTKIQGAIEYGFWVRWIAGIGECFNCQKSGGACGYDWDSNQTTCYCRDQSSLSCPSSPNTKAPSQDDDVLPTPGKSSSSKVGIGIGVAVGVAALVGILGCVYFMVQRRKKNAERSRSKELFMAPSSGGPTSSTTTTSQSVSSYSSSISESLPKSYYYGVQVFNYDELEQATKNFDPSRELGEGGFGTVYKGILQDGRVVAVKRHYESNFKRAEQFMNEVKILAPLRHKNLVTLFGCTSRHSRELLLVYEFIPNGTLDDHLHGKSSKSTLLPWPVRFSIALETAEALAYLHSKDVIHRDVKSNNILLTEKFQVKVADFGLSRLFPSFVTHVSTAPQGTPGYVDPEYYQNYQLTDKSDVYSFGVVLVELISSLQAVDITRRRNEVNLASMAVNRILSQALHELIDPYLGFEKDNGVRKTVTAVAELAFRCLQQQREMRPSMNEVLEILKAIKDDEYGSREAEIVVDIKTEEIKLLKKVPSPISPDSVADKWVSSSSTSSSY